MWVARLLAERSRSLKADKGEHGQNYPNTEIASRWNRTERKWRQRETALLSNTEQDDGCQHESHAYFKDHKGQVNVRGLPDPPVAEGKGNAKCQNKPEAPVQIKTKPAHHQCFHVDSEQRKGIWDADDYRDKPEPGRQVARVFPQPFGHEGIGRAAGREFPRELAVLVGDEQSDDKCNHVAQWD